MFPMQIVNSGMSNILKSEIYHRELTFKICAPDCSQMVFRSSSRHVRMRSEK